MKPVRFNMHHLGSLQEWYRARGTDPKDAFPQYLPLVGFVVEGVAAGFLYQADGEMALIEGIITNPEASKRDRFRAVDLVTDALVDVARSHGKKLILGLTKNRSIGSLGKRHGFRDLGPYRLYVKEI